MGSITGMKLSVSLPPEDVAFVDDYARREGSASRSLVLHQAIQLLRAAELETAYADAYGEWADGDDGAAWDQSSADGVNDVPR